MADSSSKAPAMDPLAPPVVGRLSKARVFWMPSFDCELDETQLLSIYPATVSFPGLSVTYPHTAYIVKGTETVEELSARAKIELIKNGSVSKNAELFFFTEEDNPIAIPPGTTMAAVFYRTSVLNLTCLTADQTPEERTTCSVDEGAGCSSFVEAKMGV